MSLFGEHLVMFRSFPWIFFVLKYMEEPQPGWTSILESIRPGVLGPRIFPVAERRERVVNFELIYAAALVVQPMLASVCVFVWIIDPHHNWCAVHAVVSTAGIFKTD